MEFLENLSFNTYKNLKYGNKTDLKKITEVRCWYVIGTWTVRFINGKRRLFGIRK